MKVEERPHGCLADAEGKWRLHPIPVREGNMTVESNFPPRLGFGPAISCHLEAHIRPRFEPRPGFEPGTDPGFSTAIRDRGREIVYYKYPVQTQISDFVPLFLPISTFSEVGHVERSSTCKGWLSSGRADRKGAFELNR